MSPLITHRHPQVSFSADSLTLPILELARASSPLILRFGQILTVMNSCHPNFLYYIDSEETIFEQPSSLTLTLIMNYFSDKEELSTSAHPLPYLWTPQATSKIPPWYFSIII